MDDFKKNMGISLNLKSINTYKLLKWVIILVVCLAAIVASPFHRLSGYAIEVALERNLEIASNYLSKENQTKLATGFVTDTFKFIDKYKDFQKEIPQYTRLNALFKQDLTARSNNLYKAFENHNSIKDDVTAFEQTEWTSMQDMLSRYNQILDNAHSLSPLNELYKPLDTGLSFNNPKDKEFIELITTQLKPLAYVESSSIYWKEAAYKYKDNWTNSGDENKELGSFALPKINGYVNDHDFFDTWVINLMLDIYNSKQLENIITCILILLVSLSKFSTLRKSFKDEVAKKVKEATDAYKAMEEKIKEFNSLYIRSSLSITRSNVVDYTNQLSALQEQFKALENEEAELNDKKDFLGDNHPELSKLTKRVNEAIAINAQVESIKDFYTQYKDHAFAESNLTSAVTNLHLAEKRYNESYETLKVFQDELDTKKPLGKRQSEAQSNMVRNKSEAKGEMEKAQAEKPLREKLFAEASVKYQEFCDDFDKDEIRDNEKICKDFFEVESAGGLDHIRALQEAKELEIQKEVDIIDARLMEIDTLKVQLTNQISAQSNLLSDEESKVVDLDKQLKELKVKYIADSVKAKSEGSLLEEAQKEAEQSKLDLDFAEQELKDLKVALDKAQTDLGVYTGKEYEPEGLFSKTIEFSLRGMLNAGHWYKAKFDASEGAMKIALVAVPVVSFIVLVFVLRSINITVPSLPTTPAVPGQ